MQAAVAVAERGIAAVVGGLYVELGLQAGVEVQFSLEFVAQAAVLVVMLGSSVETRL